MFGGGNSCEDICSCGGISGWWKEVALCGGFSEGGSRWGERMDCETDCCRMGLVPGLLEACRCCCCCCKPRRSSRLGLRCPPGPFSWRLSSGLFGPELLPLLLCPRLIRPGDVVSSSLPTLSRPRGHPDPGVVGVSCHMKKKTGFQKLYQGQIM